LNILLFYSSELSTLGGAELSVLGLAEGLQGRGHFVTLIEYLSGQSKGRIDANLNIISLPRAFYPRLRRPISVFRFVRSVWHSYRVIRHIRPDVVSVQFPSWQSVPIVILSLMPHRWHLAITVRGSDVRTIPVTQPHLARWQKTLFRRAESVTAVSESLRDDTLSLYPFVRASMGVIHNAPDRRFFENSAAADPRIEREHFVLFVGSVSEAKGVDTLLQAWRLIQEQIQPMHLVLVGEGEELQRMIALSKKLHIDTSVRFAGPKDQADLPLLYRNAELVVIPSLNEGLPRVALEAGACGALCVATNVGGLAEVIRDEVTGFLVAPRSPKALADTIWRAVNLSMHERQQISKAAKDRVRRYFGYSEMVQSYEELFLSLRS
jgi:glycosyltransferase involved in cell wall biosynthesis